MTRRTRSNDQPARRARVGDGGDLLDAEATELRAQLREARETLDAIRTGAVDALVLGSPGDERIFTLSGADRPYRLLVEAMHEGAATISTDGIVLYANARLGHLLGRPANDVVATPVLNLVRRADRPALAKLLSVGVGEHAQAEFELDGGDRPASGVLLSIVGVDLDGWLLRSLVATDLTDRRRSEHELATAHAKLRESELLLRTAMNAMIDGMSIATSIRDPDGRIIDFRIEYANASLARLGRVAAADQIGHTLLELFPAHGDNGLLERYVEVVETGSPVEVVEMHYLDLGAAGGPLDQYLDIRASKLGDGFVQTVRDVSESRKTAARLRESEFFFRESQRAAAIGSFRATFGEDDHWDSSEVLDTIFGIDASYPHNVAGWMDLVHPDDRSVMGWHLQHDVIEQKGSFAREYRIIRPADGATRWVSGLGDVTVDEDGRVVSLAGTVQDITDRKDAEHQMRRLSMAIEQSADAVVITNAAGEIEYVNPAFEQVSGYTSEEALGQNPRILKSGAHGPEFYARMWNTLSSGRPFSAEMTNRRKDGSVYQEEAVISPIHEANGKITSYVAVKRDVTRELVREATLQRLAAHQEVLAAALADVRREPTAEGTAASICQPLLRLGSISSAAVYFFAHDDRAVPLAFTLEDGVPVPSRPLPQARGRALRERASSGVWVEPWINRPWHPHNKVFGALGVTAIAAAPIQEHGAVIGLLEITSSAPDGPSTLTHLLPALVELAGLAGATIGPAIADMTALRGIRARVATTIRHRAFRSVYQPIVDISTGRHVGYEALTRFTYGPPPDLFFADARAVGLEGELELATLARAIESAVDLPRDAWLSLNVSPDFLMNESGLARLLRRAHRPVVLEITEHANVDDYAALVERVTRIRPKVRIAVDDAGAGIANFNHIVELRPAFVKLDIGLIRNIDQDRTRQALVVGLLHFARLSETTAIAEGVETEGELEMLKSLGVTLVQGYLLGRPASSQEWVKPKVA